MRGLHVMSKHRDLRHIVVFDLLLADEHGECESDGAR